MNANETTSVRRVAFLLALLGGLLPVVLYGTMMGRVPNLAPEAVKEILSRPEATGVLVDVRTPEEFAARHLEAARNWPYQQITALGSAQDVPQDLRGKRLFLLCESGILSGLAAQRLRDRGVWDVTNVQGGMQAWVAAAEKPCTLGLCRLRAASGAAQAIPFRESPWVEQAVAVVTGFAVKPLYTLVAFLLAVWLWRRREPDLAALRWAMICFFVGENCCAANYAVGDQSVVLEYLHSYGMVLCFALTVYALLEGLDRRMLRLSEPEARCAALGLCRRCIKHADVPCGLRRVWAWLLPAVLVVALAPLCAELLPVSYNTRIFGTFYNYSHPVVHQIFEIRYLPLAAVVLLAISWGILLRARGNAVLWSKVFFAAGCGAIGFSFFRLALFQVYRDNLVWFGAWEELTELLFVLAAGLLLWIFRDALFARPAES